MREMGEQLALLLPRMGLVKDVVMFKCCFMEAAPYAGAASAVRRLYLPYLVRYFFPFFLLGVLGHPSDSMTIFVTCSHRHRRP